MNKRIKVIPFPEIDNAYIVISAHFNPEKVNHCSSNLSFFYVKDSIGVEWEPNYGPITVIYQCDENHPKAEPHWYFDFYTGSGNWSQIAVNKERLGERFAKGEYEQIFDILRRWANNN